MTKFSWESAKRPILALAPMAGYTDSAYRRLIKSIEPRVICFTEFTSVDGIIYASPGSLRQLDFNPNEEKPLVAQIFGSKPEHFTEAAKRLEEMGVDAIDINMGCPAKKIVSNDYGSALLKNPTHAVKLVEATVKGTSLPVSVKTRVGSSCYISKDFIPFCKDLESAGAKLLSIHGRTASQMYAGLADWEAIYEVKRNVGIPVIGNGDVKGGEDALKKLGNLDGVMVGRATMGNPWVMAEIAAAFYGEEYKAPQTFLEKIPTILKHCELMVELKGEERGMIEMRKHFVGGLRGFNGASEYRQRMVLISTLAEAKSILNEIQNAWQHSQTA